MPRISPILPLHENAEAIFAPYGTADAPTTAVPVVQTYGQLAIEYAAIRKSCGLLDLPQRSTLIVTGADRLTFLNRMLTQELKGLPALACRRSFWLNRKGRIDADLRLINLADRIILDVDIHAAQRTLTTLNAYIITEDVTITDASEQVHRLALHGPTALKVLGMFAKNAAATNNDAAAANTTLAPDTARLVTIAGAEIIVDRWDSTGEIGLELFIPAAAARAVYETLLQATHTNTHEERANPSPLLRPIGWAAYNIARIEAGTPLYLLDFGPDSLPGETSLLDDRVSFKKGCYLGQEVVARMNALGKPKKRLVALRFADAGNTAAASAPAESSDESAEPTLAPFPDTGALVFAASAEASSDSAPTSSTPPPLPAPEHALGAITSATLAPMLSRSAIAFAMVKWQSGEPGTVLRVVVDDGLLRASVQSGLTFVDRADALKAT